MTKVLVTGAGGQDAYYLIPKLTAMGYEVFGMVRPGPPERYGYFRDIPFLTLVQGDLLDYPSLVSIYTEIVPDIVINMAGITSPAACWGTPELALHTNGIAATRFLEIAANPALQFIQFGSIADFGPYGASKIMAQTMVDDFRARGFNATTIRFAGHHSPRRSSMFFSRRVTKAVAEIKRNKQGFLHLGNLGRTQDWGCADEFMDAVMEILTLPPGTYTIGTHDPHTLEEFVAAAFEAAGMDWQDYVIADDFVVQPVDVPSLTVQATLSLDWEPTRTFKELVTWMVEADLAG